MPKGGQRTNISVTFSTWRLNGSPRSSKDSNRHQKPLLFVDDGSRSKYCRSYLIEFSFRPPGDGTREHEMRRWPSSLALCSPWLDTALCGSLEMSGLRGGRVHHIARTQDDRTSASTCRLCASWKRHTLHCERQSWDCASLPPGG